MRSRSRVARAARRASPIGCCGGCAITPQVRADGVITREVADAALRMLDVDVLGLDVMDRKLLLAVLEKFGGGPVGVDNLAAAIGEERDTIEDVLEPYLIQQGYLSAHRAGAWRRSRRFTTWASRRRPHSVEPRSVGEPRVKRLGCARARYGSSAPA